MLIDRIKEVAPPLCEDENLELVNLEYITGQKEDIVRVYLDKPGGITMEDCVYVSNQLGDLIDVQIEDIGRYRLEVSSPGPNRPLNNKNDYLRFKGQKIKIETHVLIADTKKFTGILEIINDDSVVIAVDGKEVEIADNLIKKAILAGQ